MTGRGGRSEDLSAGSGNVPKRPFNILIINSSISSNGGCWELLFGLEEEDDLDPYGEREELGDLEPNGELDKESDCGEDLDGGVAESLLEYLVKSESSGDNESSGDSEWREGGVAESFPLLFATDLV